MESIGEELGHENLMKVTDNFGKLHRGDFFQIALVLRTNEGGEIEVKGDRLDVVRASRSVGGRLFRHILAMWVATEKHGVESGRHLAEMRQLIGAERRRGHRNTERGGLEGPVLFVPGVDEVDDASGMNTTVFDVWADATHVEVLVRSTVGKLLPHFGLLIGQFLDHTDVDNGAGQIEPLLGLDDDGAAFGFRVRIRRRRGRLAVVGDLSVIVNQLRR